MLHQRAILVLFLCVAGCSDSDVGMPSVAAEDVGTDVSVDVSADAEPDLSERFDSANARFRSDYFVFVSDDGEDPLIVPIDINWEPRGEEEIFIELKAWKGTRAPWPIVYVAETRGLDGAPFPLRWEQVPSVEEMGLGEGQIVVERSDFGRLVLSIPSVGEAMVVVEEDALRLSSISAVKTTMMADDRLREGWLIHEHLQVARFVKRPEDESQFTRFHWIPAVTGGNLYLFRDSGRGQQALRWSENEVMRLDTFEFEVVEERPESFSGRERVPETWRIAAAPWGVVLTLNSGAGHTGYGEAKESGLALYRQALVEGVDQEGGAAHGMVELILED